MKTAPQLQAFIEGLAEKHGVVIRQPGAYLRLDLDAGALSQTKFGRAHLVLEHLGARRIAIVYQLHLFHGWVTDTEIVLWLATAVGWAPIEINQIQGGRCSYAELDANGDLIDFPFPQGQAALADWAEGFAANLTAEGWLAQGVQSTTPRPVYTHEAMLAHGSVSTEPLPAEPAGAPQGRMAGCQSTNHDQCYGELWQCAACGKTVCYAEGSDDHPEWCDDCWVQAQGAQEGNDVLF